MSQRRNATTYLRGAMIAVALVLPALSLISLGSLWLWEKGYLLTWVVAAFAVSGIGYLGELWLVRWAKAPERAVAADHADQGFTPREAAAWKDVEALASATDPATLTNRDAVLDLGQRTIETVARAIHPDDKDPLWRFTVPEALALIERVSRDLGPFVADNVPLGDQLTIAQVIQIYRWRGVVDAASQAYDLWRLVRLLNPVAAITTEARERLTKKLYTGARDELARRLTRGFVTEVGRAAIDLYGGRLRVSAEALHAHQSEVAVRDRALESPAEPLRILVAGQISAGKSSLINALGNEMRAAVDVLPATRGFTPYSLKSGDLPSTVLIDSPGITPDSAALTRLAQEAGACDLIVWVVAANRADRETDRKALGDVRAWFAAHPERRQPPMVGVVTHIDLLRPYQEWSPPYDIADPKSAKATTIRAAMDHIAADLGLTLDQLVPVALAEGRAAYNVDVLWAELSEALPDAKRAQLIRRLRDASGWTWSKLWSQAVNAGRVTARIVTK